MVFIKHSVMEIGIEESVPGWLKKAHEATEAEISEGADSSEAFDEDEVEEEE